MKKMCVTYQCDFKCQCPIDPELVDHYTLLVEAHAIIVVEDLHELLASYAEKTMFQEDITADIASRFVQIGKVTTSGFHSGVKTVCTVEIVNAKG